MWPSIAPHRALFLCQVLFLLALRQQQLRPASDPASYYQLLGIHGAPFKVYRGVAPPGLRCDPSKQW